jgi:hypothetical protein
LRVVGDMKLDDARIELAGELRYPGSLPARHRNYDVVGLEPSVSGSRHEAVALSRQSVHPHTGLRTVYSITEAGKEALREWLGTPISPFSMDFEAMLRLFVVPLGTKDDITGTLKQVRADTHEMLEFSGKVKQEFIDGINVTQDQVYIRALVVDFFISLLNTVEAWAERTLAEIETWDDLLPSEEKNTTGLQKIRQLPVATPAESLKHIAKPPKSQMRTRS